MRNFTINQTARKAVYARSQGICERCHRGKAVHLHHLTYERAGHEHPNDLLHICIVCHCLLHPEKAPDIFDWEAAREKPPNVPQFSVNRKRVREYDEEPEREDNREREREEEHEQEAWNLGKFESSGYCIEDVEREEEYRSA